MSFMILIFIRALIDSSAEGLRMGYPDIKMWIKLDLEGGLIGAVSWSNTHGPTQNYSILRYYFCYNSLQ